MSTERAEKEAFIRSFYQAAEVKDVPKTVSYFTVDGEFNNESTVEKYRGNTLGKTVEVYARAFPDMHREVYDIYIDGDTIVVELSLNGTHNGPLELPMGMIPATGRKMKTPCCDVFHLRSGKIQVFNCYPSATILLGQIGVLGNLEAVLAH